MIDSIDLIEKGETFVNLMNAVFAKESQPLTADYCGSHESRDVQCFSVVRDRGLHPMFMIEIATILFSRDVTISGVAEHRARESIQYFIESVAKEQDRLMSEY